MRCQHAARENGKQRPEGVGKARRAASQGHRCAVRYGSGLLHSARRTFTDTSPSRPAPHRGNRTRSARPHFSSVPRWESDGSASGNISKFVCEDDENGAVCVLLGTLRVRAGGCHVRAYARTTGSALLFPRHTYRRSTSGQVRTISVASSCPGQHVSVTATDKIPIH
jgi:hypothetical protein